MNFKFPLLSCCALFILHSPLSAQQKLKLSNKTFLERSDELIVLSRADVKKKISDLNSSDFIGIKDINDKNINVQFDDLDKDGIWDELAFLHSFNPKEKVILTLNKTNQPLQVSQVKAHVRHKRKNADDTFAPAILLDSVPAGQPATNFAINPLPPFLTEGPAWENDKVGFRIYFDVRNAKDIWGKTTGQMVLDKVGTNPKENYHAEAPWGMDVLKVGASLGAGGLALSFPYNGKDTLARLGGNKMGKIIYEVVADGPVRAIFKLHYPEWEVANNLPKVSLTEEITISGGKYFYSSKVSLKNVPAKAKLVSGIVNLYTQNSYEIENGKTAVLYTFDKQSENKDQLGMALMVAKKDLIAFGATSNTEGDIRNTYTSMLKLNNQNTAKFRFYAGWEKSEKDFTSLKLFKEFLKKETSSNSSPIKVK